MRLSVSLDRKALPTGDVRALVVYGDRMRTHSNADRNFSSLILRAWSDKGRYIPGDRSQIWSKVSTMVVLLIYSAIAIFAKYVAIWRIFPDMVTCTGVLMPMVLPCISELISSSVSTRPDRAAASARRPLLGCVN